MGPSAPEPSIDPTTQLLKQKAEEQRISAIQDRLSAETRDNLIRFGRQKAFSGAGALGPVGTKIGGFGNMAGSFGKGL